jgi:class 3 adenylate cyclase
MTLRREWTWEFDVPRDRLWRYLGDTDWVNEHAGLPRIDVRYEPVAQGGSRRFASFGFWPVVVEWEEMPTIWRSPEFFSVERRYRRGPLRRFANRTSLQALGEDRTRVVVELELAAANPLFEPLLPLVAAGGKRGANRAFRLAARLGAEDGRAPRTAGGALEARLVSLRVPEEVAAAIAAFVDTAEDRDLQRMRPYELADAWRLGRREVLRGFLTATRAGLFNLRWNVICPGCRGPSPAFERLESLGRDYHCPACNVPFDAIFDRSVEVTFSARPLGKAKDERLFCLASPRRSEHVYAQFAVAAGAQREFALALPPGSYDLNAVSVGLLPFVATPEGDAEAFAATLEDGAVDGPHAVRSGSLHFAVANRLERDAIVRVEDGRWPDTIATAAQVTALQEFRDLFSSEVLTPGLDLGIESMAVLFTDVVGSTAMYSRSGDAPAFRIVREHFDALREVVARHDGAVVKTIGDAIMAVFADPGACFAAALELDRCVQSIDCGGAPLRLRVGFHAGPCIAMRANDRIDYFGTTVNLAARLESLAGAGEVTMAREDAERPSVATQLTPDLMAGGERLAIKGFDRPIEVVRVRALGRNGR